MKVVLFGNTFQTEKSKYVAQILKHLQQHRVDICIEKSFLLFIQTEMGMNDVRLPLYDESLTDIDLAISVGGDGTFLNTAAKIGAKKIPILGVNTGRLGFLADVSPEEFETAFSAIERGEYVTDERSVLEVRTEHGLLQEETPYALNDITVLKHDNSSTIEVNAYVNGQHLIRYISDGLIVSTPTGSTGYSLSVGGPIMSPDSNTFCLSAVAPHSLSVRPVVLQDNVNIRLEITSRSKSYLLSLDGRSISLPDSETIHISKASFKVGVVKVNHKNFFDTLRDKLSWGADGR